MSKSLRPLIAICGTTGVGKSNLAIEIALHLSRGSRSDNWRGARIINADSMQVYRGLDILTNKVPEAERRGIDHLLMGFKAPGEQYMVGQWVQDALKAIDDTHRRNEIPIVVGGTSYWIQHLLFPNRLAPDNQASTPELPPDIAREGHPQDEELADIISSLPPNFLTLYHDLPIHPPSASDEPEAAIDLHTLLSMLDPLVANRWHWKDTRKVLRSLGVIKASGKRASDIIREQSRNLPASKPRFRTLCLWLYAEPSVLQQRLNDRVDRMIEQDLFSEIHTLRRTVTAAKGATDIAPDACAQAKANYTTGIFQSIGYKEFDSYLSAADPPEEAFHAAVDHMKVSTRQYAKRQVSWIRNKMLPAVHAANAEETVIPMYLLDATVLGEQWNGDVRDVATQLTEDFLSQKDLPDPILLSERAQKMMKADGQSAHDPLLMLTARQKRVCDVCSSHPGRPFMVEEGREWEAHCKSRIHRRREKRQIHHTGRHDGSTSNDSDTEYLKLFT